MSPKVLNPGSVNEWRSISLTSCFGKIQERFIMMRLIPSALNQSKNLYAYLPLDSMTAALVRAIHTWLSETESQITKVTFFFLLVDMSKVFD